MVSLAIARMVWVIGSLWLLLGSVVIRPVVAKSAKRSRATRNQSKRETECARTECKHLHPDENDDCVNRCASITCHAEIFGSQPLEPGEIDRVRRRDFKACVLRQSQDERG
mmetsp:Transcript_98269/g.194681  ORF Transcript_98269/g.194681 Transcript_98269/m.194681 type:complete len:111 (-) Transcript_98269:114-446(-)